jgi:hypothetical protein
MAADRGLRRGSAGTFERMHAGVEIQSSRHSLSSPSLSTQFGPECGAHVHTKLLQCDAKRLSSDRGGFDAGTALDGADGSM